MRTQAQYSAIATKLADVKLKGRYLNLCNNRFLSMRLNPIVSTFLPYLKTKATTKCIKQNFITHWLT